MNVLAGQHQIDQQHGEREDVVDLVADELFLI